MTAKRAAKAKKAKAKQAPAAVQPSIKAPDLPSFLPPVTYPALSSEVAVPRWSSRTSSMFTYDCGSQKFQADLRAFQTQKLHLLMLLKAKRREELLRRKLELEEEKERLTRALAADLKNKGKAAAAAAAASKRLPAAGTAPATAPPSAPLPPPPTLPPSSGDAAVTPPALGNKPPPKKGKKKRSAYANANNAHHRQNYVPSRLPASSGGKKDTPESIAAATGGSLDLALPHDNESEVFNFGPDDWMCTFCEYELWYGTKPQLAKCVKKRKKLLKVRQKALDRAKGTVEGTHKSKSASAAAAPPAAAPTAIGTAVASQRPAGEMSPTTPKSAATLPGTAEQQAKAENAKPTRAPPPSPASKNAALKGGAPPAATLAGPQAGKELERTRNQLGISQEKLLACKNGLSQALQLQLMLPRRPLSGKQFARSGLLLYRHAYTALASNWQQGVPVPGLLDQDW